MRAVWSDQHKYELWLRIEVLACEAWASVGRIPESALPKIRNGTFDATKIAEVESRVGHDVVAFLTVLNESIGQPEARYVHLGMTSQDLNDTAMALQMVESARLIVADLTAAREGSAELATPTGDSWRRSRWPPGRWGGSRPRSATSSAPRSERCSSRSARSRREAPRCRTSAIPS